MGKNERWKRVLEGKDLRFKGEEKKGAFTKFVAFLKKWEKNGKFKEPHNKNDFLKIGYFLDKINH